MRISDWISDVCSSYLRVLDRNPAPPPRTERRAPVRFRRHDLQRVGESRRAVEHLQAERYRILAGLLRQFIAEAFDRARKSVVPGKSVSVRVDLGGRRIIKKKIIPSISR